MQDSPAAKVTAVRALGAGPCDGGEGKGGCPLSPHTSAAVRCDESRVGAGHSGVELGTKMAHAIQQWGFRAHERRTPTAPFVASARDRFERAVFGRSLVWCEECGIELAARRAVWRGQHAYCSASHEAADSA